jgi:hypothetical protein
MADWHYNPLMEVLCDNNRYIDAHPAEAGIPAGHTWRNPRGFDVENVFYQGKGKKEEQGVYELWFTRHRDGQNPVRWKNHRIGSEPMEGNLVSTIFKDQEYVLYKHKTDKFIHALRFTGRRWEWDVEPHKNFKQKQAASAPAVYTTDNETSPKISVVYSIYPEGGIAKLSSSDGNDWTFLSNTKINATGNLAACFGQGNEFVFYRSSDDEHIRALDADLKPIEEFPSETKAESNPTAYLVKEQPCVVYRSEGGIYRSTFNGYEWSTNPIRTTVPYTPTGTLTACVWDGKEHIFYRQDGEIYQLSSKDGDHWGIPINVFEQVSKEAPQPEKAQSDPYAYCWDETGTGHVVYVGTDDQIHELWDNFNE